MFQSVTDHLQMFQ